MQTAVLTAAWIPVEASVEGLQSMTETSNTGEQVAARRTYKILGNPADPAPVSAIPDAVLDEMLQQAGNAPVHYACDRVHLGKMASPVPWRAYKLNRKGCLDLMNHLVREGDVTKVPALLATAQFLVQVTWLPDEGTVHAGDGGKHAVVFDGTLRNMEHIAAASAFAQSLLLVADACGFRTYWSSGGGLRGKAVFDHLGIPDREILIGSIFLYPAEAANTEVKPGSMAERRGKLEDWSRWTG